MKFKLLNITVEIKQNFKELGEPENCILNRIHLKNNETDFFFDVKNVARYRVQDGKMFPFVRMRMRLLSTFF